jgi:hypothetical protein
LSQQKDRDGLQTRFSPVFASFIEGTGRRIVAGGPSFPGGFGQKNRRRDFRPAALNIT